MAPQPLLSGDPRMVGDYALRARLGSGGMGEVFLADGPLGERVAVKLLHRSVTGDAQARARLAREVRTLARVRGPHLAEVLHADPDAPRPYIVTRYVPGPTLEERVASAGPLDDDGLVALATGLGRALAAVHAAGVVHRDLKPGNVVCGPEGPTLLDFGIAAAVDEAGITRAGELWGTAAYLAPEQVVSGAYGPASDVHALAATVAFAASGRPLYGTGRADAVLYRVVHDDPVLPPMPPALESVCRQALDRDPSRRPPAGALVTALTTAPTRALTRPVTAVLTGARPGSTQTLPPPPVRQQAPPRSGPPPPPPNPWAPPRVPAHRGGPGPWAGRGVALLVVALLAGLALLAPVVLPVLTYAVLLPLHDAGARVYAAAAERRRRRGRRSDDVPMALLGFPAALLRALLGAVLRLPLAVLVAVVVGGMGAVAGVLLGGGTPEAARFASAAVTGTLSLWVLSAGRSAKGTIARAELRHAAGATWTGMAAGLLAVAATGAWLTALTGAETWAPFAEQPALPDPPDLPDLPIP